MTIGAIVTAGGGAVAFSDRVGDVRGGRGPDLAAIEVSSTRTAVTFRIRFAGAIPGVSTSGRWVDMVVVGIDVPPRGLRPASPGGPWPGADYAAGWHGTDRTGMLVKAPRWAKVGKFRVTVNGRTASFSLSRASLGNPVSFDFVVTAARELPQESSGEGGFDTAPERGTFHYRLTG